MKEAGVEIAPARVRALDVASYDNAVDDRALRHNGEAHLRADINRLLERPDSTRRLLQACTEAIVTDLHALLARIWTLKKGQKILELRASSGLYTHLHGIYSRVPVGQCIIGLIAENRAPYLTNAALGDSFLDQDWVKQEKVVAFAGYPLIVDDRVVGVIAMFARFPMPPETLETIGSIAGIIAQGIERKRSQNELRRSIQANHEAVVGERRRIAREMHDGLLQNVTGIALQLRAVLPHVRSAPDEAATVLERILELAERTNTEARQAVVGMRHFSESRDIVKLLRNTIERNLEGTRLGLTFRVRGRSRLMPSRVCEAAASIVEQATTNVVQHAHAQTVQLSMDFGFGRLRISIRDDGRGFVADRSTNGTTHFGLLGMHERAREIGARLRVRSALHRGTTIGVTVSYRK